MKRFFQIIFDLMFGIIGILLFSTIILTVCIYLSILVIALSPIILFIIIGLICQKIFKL